MSNARIRAEHMVKGLRQGERTRQLYASAILGDGNGNVDASTAHGAGWVYARLYARADTVVVIFNPSMVPLIEGVAVDLERVRQSNFSFYKTVGLSASIIYDGATVGPGTNAPLVAHQVQHQRRDRNAGGYDALDLYTRGLINLRARAQTTPDLTLYVERGFYIFSSVTEWLGGNSPAFVPPTNALTQRWDLLYLGADDALHITTGTEVSLYLTPLYPAAPSPSIPLAYVLITSGLTMITEAYVTDARVLWTGNQVSAPPSGAAGGDLTGTYPNPTLAVRPDLVLSNQIFGG